MLTSDNNYSYVIQETQAETVILEMAKETFQDHLANTDQNQAEKDLRGNVKPGTFPSTNTLGPTGLTKKHKPTNNCSLGFMFPGECYKLKKDTRRNLRTNFFKDKLKVKTLPNGY